MQKPTVVSLYDMTGNMLRPWAAAGFDCHCYDIQNDGRREHVGTGSITYHNGNLTSVEVLAEIVRLNPVFITSFTPCDDLTSAGSRHWHAKSLRDPEFQDKAVGLAKVAYQLGTILDVPYMVENPVGMLSSLWRKPNTIFHPYQFGGYLPEDDQHPSWPDIYPPRDRYTKRTCLWFGNWFLMPAYKPLTPVSLDNPGWAKLGGKSQRTKNIRSATPRGFAQAVFERNWQNAWRLWEARRKVS